MTKKKITIVICSQSETASMLLEHVLTEEGYEVFLANDGEQCLQLVKEKHPRLVFLDLILPKVHGNVILKQIKTSPILRDIGVIIVTTRPFPQDYQGAIENGADYYYLGPINPTAISRLTSRFIEGTLSPDPYPNLEKVWDQGAPYHTEPTHSLPYMKLWGTRGSIPVSGPDYHVYGGNTSCLEIRDKDTLIIIDAGTGIRALGEELFSGAQNELHLFFGHTHWDHILGFPFFLPLYHPRFTIHIYATAGFGRDIKDLLRGMMDTEYFPVQLQQVRARLVFHDFDVRTPVQIGAVLISGRYAFHPGVTLCFKIQAHGQTICYVTDNEMLVGYHGDPKKIQEDHLLIEPYQDLIQFFKGSSLLIHEAQYTPEVYLGKVGWGHSSISNATVLIRHCGIKEWLVTHHDPADNDEALQKKLLQHHAILRDCDIDCRVHFARDHLVLPLEGGF